MGKYLRNRISLMAEGISCAGCAEDIETVFKNTNGILDVKVNYSTGTINIEYSPEEITTDRIISIAKKLGLNTSLL